MFIAAGIVVLLLASLELVVFVEVMHLLGLLPAIALLTVIGLVGARVCKREGLAIVARVRSAVAERRLPGNSLLDSGIVLLAGALLVVPGFITAAIGLVLLLPPVRALARGVIRATLVRRFAAATFYYG